MWTEDESPVRDSVSAFPAPASVALGAEAVGFSSVIGGLTSLIHQRKSSLSPNAPLHVVDMRLGDGDLAESLVKGLRSRPDHQGTAIKVSGIDSNPDGLQAAQARLQELGALGQIHEMDAASTVGRAIRNRLEVAGGGDLVVFGHGAYPSHMPEFKLQRMVDRLEDVVSPHGAAVTLHNHGASDIDGIRTQALGLSNFSAPGLNCGTHAKLENAFSDSKMHAFSVTVPNMIKLPANLSAVNAIFAETDSELSGKDAQDAAAIRTVLEVVAGGKDQLAEAIADLDGDGRQRASQFFEQKMVAAKGDEFPLTVGGGQMVVAFRDPQLACAAFAAVTLESETMHPPALALPISNSVGPRGFDKQAAHQEWAAKLTNDYGITTPPDVPQAVAGINRLR